MVLVVRDSGSSDSAAPTTTVKPGPPKPLLRIALTDRRATAILIGPQGTSLATFHAIFGRPVAVDVVSGTAAIDSYQDATGEHPISTGRVLIPSGSGSVGFVVRGVAGATVKIVATELVPDKLTLGTLTTGEVGPKTPLRVYSFSLESPARLNLDFGGPKGRPTASRALVVDALGFAVSDLQGHALSATGDHFLIVEWLGRPGAQSKGTRPTAPAKFEFTLSDQVGTLEFDKGPSLSGTVSGIAEFHATLHVPPNVAAALTLTPSGALRAGLSVDCASPPAPTPPVAPDVAGQAGSARVEATPAAQTCDVVVSAGGSGTEGDFTLAVAPG